MMHSKFLAMAAVVTLGGAAQAQTATPDFEYHGYLRSGIGASRGGTDQACFSAPGASAKFRLGNECETYLEATFVKNHALSNTASLSTTVTFAAVTAGRHDWESTSAGVTSVATDGVPALDQQLTIALREAYVKGRGILGETQPWVGKRFYRRQDIHILDYYVINNSGPGFGVEDINLGFGKLHTAVLRNTTTSQDDTPAQTNIDLRLSDIALAGKLEVLAIHGAAGTRGHRTGAKSWEAVSGTQLGLVHTFDVLGGFNRVTIQHGLGLFGGDGTSRSTLLGSYGDGGAQAIAKGATAQRDALKDSSTTRIVEELVSQFGQSFASSFVLLYQTTDFGGLKDAAGKEVKNKTETMVGVRPVYHFTDTAALAAEYGVVSVGNAVVDANGDWKNATLHKVTLAPTLTGTGFWARPQLRLFATYAAWNKEAKGSVGGPVYAAAENGFSTGAQVEAWW